MKLKLVFAYIGLSALGYFGVALIDQPGLSLAYFHLLTVSALLLCLYLGAHLSLRVCRRLFPNIIRNPSPRLAFILFCLLTFFFLVAHGLNAYGLPERGHPISIAANAALALALISALMMLLRNASARLLFLGSISFTALLTGLVLFSALKITASHSPLSSAEDLRSLPYLSWVSAEASHDKTAVTLHDAASAQPGVNLYADYDARTAYLIDLDGRVLHSWSDNKSHWHHIDMLKDGSLLGIEENHHLKRLAWDSPEIWMLPGAFHYDFAVSNNGDIYTLLRKEAVIFRGLKPMPAINDYLVTISASGKIKQEISLYPFLKRFLDSERLPPAALSAYITRAFLRLNFHFLLTRRFELPLSTPYDLFHVNTVKEIDRDLPRIAHKGDLLLCIKYLNLLVILDPHKKALVWSWGQAELDRPHNATLLDNGHILVFDNGTDRGYSRILEIDPATKQIVWEYVASPREDFFSHNRGSCQRLPNGNTLITDSNAGRVFEIAPEGKVVWEFFSPSITADKSRRRAIYRMRRITDLDQYPQIRSLLTD